MIYTTAKEAQDKMRDRAYEHANDSIRRMSENGSSYCHLERNFLNRYCDEIIDELRDKGFGVSVEGVRFKVTW